MKLKNRFVLAILLVFKFSIANSSERNKNHEHASKAFSELHFFSEGRGMHMSPGLIDYKKFFGERSSQVNLQKRQSKMEERWGVIVRNEEISGLFAVEYKKMRIGVMGCIVCHAGKAAGRYVIGLGNKNIDVWKNG